ncbi:RNA polymerase sigma-70 factor [Streptomyces sp. URMC 123]|uniref:RNA polymerase sigma-70 factor n=1 Tax=Streptomyces sp. URMC 123 TaxID=3423403 RepID=UPI003F1D7897
MDTGPCVGWDESVAVRETAETADAAVGDFEAHRPLLIGVAYRMLGRVADAEDVVQEAWLRWSGTDRGAVREPRAYLVRVTTRLAIDRLRQLSSRKEAYVGPWLPEPIVTEYADTVPDAADRAVLADSVSLAVLVVLESLSPLERAVFVLREAFGFPYGEIATVLDRSEAAVRQLGGRARRHVAERKPRFTVDPDQQRNLTERFLAAATGGDLGALLDLLAPDVRLVADSGGKAKAPLRVLVSADHVGRFLCGAARKSPPGMEVAFREINGAPAALLLTDGTPDAVVSLTVVDGLITCVHLLVNPDKLATLTA